MDDRRLMREAISQASGTRTHPNPRVGALVLDRSGSVAGRGAYLSRGEPHAEVVALREAGPRAAGGTVVVTLEPCNHTGATGPCTEALISAGVARVVVGSEDPDRRVSGRGVRRLRAAGIEVTTGVLADEVEAADPGYFHHRRTGLPLVTVKWAATLDGQSAASDGTARWISSQESRDDAHRLRARADAVMVGAGTLISDDPELTVRLTGYAGPQPRPVVVAGHRALPAAARVFSRDPIVYAAGEPDLPGTVVSLPGGDGVDLGAALEDLGRREVVDLLVEGGPTLLGALLRGGLVQRGVAYVAAKVAGGTGRPAVAGGFTTLTEARRARIVGVDRVGPDLRVEFELGGGL